jgi:hypothetical protein
MSARRIRAIRTTQQALEDQELSSMRGRIVVPLISEINQTVPMNHLFLN